MLSSGAQKLYSSCISPECSYPIATPIPGSPAVLMLLPSIITVVCSAGCSGLLRGGVPTMSSLSGGVLGVYGGHGRGGGGPHCYWL